MGFVQEALAVPSQIILLGTIHHKQNQNWLNKLG